MNRRRFLAGTGALGLALAGCTSPVLAFLGIFTFVNAWNDYLWPLIVMVDAQNVTLQVALNQLNGIYGTDYSLVMAGTLLAIIPLLIVFLFGARHFIRNIAAGAVKG